MLGLQHVVCSLLNIQTSEIDGSLHRLTVALLDTHREETDDVTALRTDRSETAFLIFRNLARRHPRSVMRLDVLSVSSYSHPGSCLYSGAC